MTSATPTFTTPCATAATSIHMQHGRVRVLKLFNFPKRTFSTKGKERSFRAEWCNTFRWLHCDVKTDSAFFVCTLNTEKKFIASMKGEPVFMSKGFYILERGPYLKAFKEIKEVIVTTRP